MEKFGSVESGELVVRKIDKAVYRRFKQKALARRIRLGKAITNAMEMWIEKERGEKISAKNLIKMDGIIKGTGKVRWSEEVDEILYGWKK